MKSSSLTKSKKINRVLLIILDGVGCGELPDAKKYNDIGSNSLGNLALAYKKRFNKTLSLPNLQSWGLGNLTFIEGTPPLENKNCLASYGKCTEISNGKDTTSGHWEMCGVEVATPFNTFPNGFPEDIIKRWITENNLPGILGNKAASGTDIIFELGEEHLHSGKPILYTSADSVWQIAAHEKHFGLEKLYQISKSARKICDELNISRVIARPFLGENSKNFKRTHHRKDFSQTPHEMTLMQHLQEHAIHCVGIGKIWNIFNGAGVDESIETENNQDGFIKCIESLNKYKSGFLFLNLIDFDMLYGHRRDVVGYAQALIEFDQFLPKLLAALQPNDLVLISSDHGNDPTYPGTDHTREYVPLLVYSKLFQATNLGIRKSFADIGQTIGHAFTGNANILKIGNSFLNELKEHNRK